MLDAMLRLPYCQVAEVVAVSEASRRANGLALGRFSVIYATPPCVITPRSPVQGSRAVPEHLCLTRPYVPKARTLRTPPEPPARSAAMLMISDTVPSGSAHESLAVRRHRRRN